MGSAQLTASVLWLCVTLLHAVTSQNLIKNSEEDMKKHSLLINEVNADNPGEDTLEYVELFHTSGRQAPLDGFHLVFYNGNGNLAYKVIDLRGLSTNSQGFLLIGSFALVPKPSLILSKNTIQNGPDAIALYFGNGPFYEGMSLTKEGLVDALVHKSKKNDRADELVSVLTPGVEPFLEDPFFRTTDEALERCQEKDSQWFFQVGTPTPGADNHCIVFSQLNSTVLINEVKAASFPGKPEFVELQGPPSADLKDLVLVLIEGSTQKISFAMEVYGRTSPDGLLLIGSGQANGTADLPFPENSSRLLLEVGSNAIALYAGKGSSFTPGDVASTTALLDVLVYTTEEGKASKLRDILTPGKPSFYVRPRSQTISVNVSVNRCACCSITHDASVFALGTPTPRQFNDCPKKRFSHDVVLCIQVADCQQGSQELSKIQVVLAQALDKQCNCGVSPANFKDPVVTCQGTELVFSARLAAKSAEQLNSQLQAFSALLESEEVMSFGEWNGTAGKSCSRYANATEAPPPGTAFQKPGATEAPLSPKAELLINEVNPDNPGSREDTEYIELLHPGQAPFDLRDYWLVLYNGKNNLAYKVVNLTGYHTNQQGYFLLGGSGVTPKPLILLPHNTVQNGADAVALYHSTTMTYQVNMPLTDKGLVDAVVYKSRGSDKADKLLAVLTPGQNIVLENNSHSIEDESLSRCHSLMPRNQISFQTTTITPFQENACLPLGSNSTEFSNHSVVINELGLVNSTILYQFIELKGKPGTSLQGYTLTFFSGQNAKPYRSMALQGTFESNGLLVIQTEEQSRTGEAHDHLVMPSLGRDPSAQLESHAVAVVCQRANVHNASLADGESVEDVVAYTWQPNASKIQLGPLGLIHSLSGRGERVVSLSRCSSCSAVFVVSDPTPGLENSCPRKSLSLDLRLCLQTPNCSMWSENQWTLASLRRALATAMEENCSCGISPCYLQGLNFSCFSSAVQLSGQVWARSSEQLQLLTTWQADFAASPHPFPVDGRLLKIKAAACAASPGGTTLRSEASLQMWETVLIILGTISLAALLTGTAWYCVKRRPQNYITMEMNNRCEVMANI